MGKYQYHVNDHTVKYLCTISNELAESNRLKRIEIKIKTQTGFGHTGRGTGSWIIENDAVCNELEDKA